MFLNGWTEDVLKHSKTTNMQNINGKTALITGGSKGIGLGIAQSMLDQGMKVMITGRTESALQDAKNQLITRDKENILTYVSDVRDPNSLQSAVDKLLREWGVLDVLIANAGVGHFAPIDELSMEEWQETIDINLSGVFYTLKSGMKALKSSQGYFITVASLAGTNFFANGAAYNASKFGLVGFTQAVMLDLRKYGIKVSTIMPGSVATHFADHVPSEKDNWKIQPEDIGQMVIDLLQMHPRTLPSKIEVRPSQPS
jgi:3-oxoacyl-[acyl-carrier protein] reductase